MALASGWWRVIIGIVIPAIFFLSSRFNRQPVYLVVGALCAMIGIVANRWNVTVSGLTVPLSYSPGVLYQSPRRDRIRPAWRSGASRSG